MRIFDIQKGLIHDTKPVRIGLIGSCRVFDAFEYLAVNGLATRCCHVAASTNTLGEALQLLDWASGRLEVPIEFAPYIFDTTQFPERSTTISRIISSVDVMLIEVSDFEQIRCGDFLFQSTYFFRNFVSKYGAALKNWYRALSLSENYSESLIEEALESIIRMVPTHADSIEYIIRNSKIEHATVEETCQYLAKLNKQLNYGLGIVTHFVVPDVESAGMEHRRELVRMIGASTAPNCIPVFNPSMLMDVFGREVVLDKVGRDVYHYAPDFCPTIARNLLDFSKVCLQVKSTRRFRSVTAPDFFNNISALRLKTFGEINELCCALNSDRIDRYGIEESGLYAHYKYLLDQREIVGLDDILVATLILEDLPAFPSYHVRRAGLGELPMLLASGGLNVVAFDPTDTRRRAMSEVIPKIMAQLDDVNFGQIEIAGAEDVPVDGVDPLALGVVVNLKETLSDSDEESIQLARLFSYNAILFSPRYLFRERRELIAQETFVEYVRHEGGYATIKDYPALGLVYCSRSEPF